MCCPSFNDFTNYIKSFFVKNEEQIKSEMNHFVNAIIPIILPIIKQQIEESAKSVARVINRNTVYHLLKI